MPGALDPAALLRHLHLHEHGVEHIIIGGLETMKRAAGRPQDLIDLQRLGED